MPCSIRRREKSVRSESLVINSLKKAGCGGMSGEAGVVKESFMKAGRIPLWERARNLGGALHAKESDPPVREQRKERAMPVDGMTGRIA